MSLDRVANVSAPLASIAPIYTDVCDVDSVNSVESFDSIDNFDCFDSALIVAGEASGFRQAGRWRKL